MICSDMDNTDTETLIVSIMKSTWNKISTTSKLSACDVVATSLDATQDVGIDIPENDVVSILTTIRNMIPNFSDGVTIRDIKRLLDPVINKYRDQDITYNFNSKQIIILQFVVFLMGWLLVQAKSYNENKNFNFINSIMSILQQQQDMKEALSKL